MNLHLKLKSKSVELHAGSAGWPSKSGGKSGGGRDNNPPSRK